MPFKQRIEYPRYVNRTAPKASTTVYDSYTVILSHTYFIYFREQNVAQVSSLETDFK